MTTEQLLKMMYGNPSGCIVCVSMEYCRKFGNNAAILYAEVFGMYYFPAHKYKAPKEEYIPCPVSEIEKSINLSQEQQKNAFKKLESDGLVEIKYIGLPRQRYVKVFENKEYAKEYAKRLKEIRWIANF